MFDAVVIGGGAAGIAAARTLHEGGADVLLIEASDRLGGRAHTAIVEGMPLDLGCGWLHSAERNPLVAEAEALGFTVDRTPPGWDTQWRDLGSSADEREALGAAYERFDARALAAARGPDRPLGDLNTEAFARPAIDAISGWVSGVATSQVSLHDWAAYERAGTDANWRVVEGYGALVARLAGRVPCRLGTRVVGVDHGGPALRIETDAGTVDADIAIVAVPTTVLACEAIRFTPALPDKTEAANALPLGLANKAFLAVDGAEELEVEAHLHSAPLLERTGRYKLRPFERPMIEGFYGGTAAEELEAAGPGAAMEFAIDELVALLGADWRGRLRPLVETRWRHAPGIEGAYSYARPGRRGARAALAAPMDDRIFFAGEATSPCDFTTAHGAWRSGLAAGWAALAALGADGGGAAR